MSFPFRGTLWAADEFKPFTLSEKSKINFSVLNPWNLSCLLSSLIRLSLMETDSLSCLRSVGAGVPFTFPDVLFKIDSLNLDSLSFDGGCAWTRKGTALFFFCLHVGVLFFYCNQTYSTVQYRRLQRAYRSNCMSTLFTCQMSEQNIGEKKTLSPSSARFC